MSRDSVRLVIFATLALTAAVPLSSSALTNFDIWLRANLLLADTVDPRLREAVRDVTAIGSFPVILGGAAVAASLLAATRRRVEIVLLAVTLAAATISNLGLKLVFAKPRPPADERLAMVFTLSYPSGHALMIGVTTGALALLCTAAGSNARRVAIAAAALVSFFVGLSRLTLGVHWPTDVLAGWLTAVALLLLLAAAQQTGPFRRRQRGNQT